MSSNHLQQDVKRIRKCNKVIVQADKTSNLYELTKEEYNQLINNNVTATYRRAKDGTVDEINQEARDITEELGVSDRVRALPLKPAFVTLKDHKPNFNTNPTCRLLNPTKSEVGIISKQILDKVNNNIRIATSLVQWTNTDQVIAWFKTLQRGKQQFLKFDVKDFYPSISKELFGKALSFAKKYSPISEQEEKIVYNATKSVLYHDDKIWVKKTRSADEEELFDITMGGFHGAEVCELVGLYMIDGLTKILPGGNVGLYRDDGLAAIPKQPGPETERLKKKIHAYAHSIGLRFEIEVPSPRTEYLDIVMDLEKHTFMPYRKPDNIIKYINQKSNHPGNITRRMKSMIENLISRRSSDEEVFKSAAGVYSQALNNNGYKGDIKYQNAALPKKTTRNRARIWFNPPFCKSVKGCIGKTFIALVKMHFHSGHPLHKILNNHKIGFSYSCMPNLKSILAAHNKKILGTNIAEATAPCNCTKFECPIKVASCRSRNVVYEATVNSNDGQRKYVGLASEFKDRYYQHRQSFSKRANKDDTALAQHVWYLKDKNLPYEISWKFLAKTGKARVGSTTCRLCLKEAAEILKMGKGKLNKRREINGKCRHVWRHFIKNWKSEKQKEIERSEKERRRGGKK